MARRRLSKLPANTFYAPNHRPSPTRLVPLANRNTSAPTQRAPSPPFRTEERTGERRRPITAQRASALSASPSADFPIGVDHRRQLAALEISAPVQAGRCVPRRAGSAAARPHAQAASSYSPASCNAPPLRLVSSDTAAPRGDFRATGPSYYCLGRCPIISNLTKPSAREP